MNVTDRFLQYVSFDTQSDENSPTAPSTEKQKLLGAFLAEEMRLIGMEDVCLTDKGYVYGTIPANTDKAAPVLGLIAHMDTSPDCPGGPVRPSVIAYEGGDIVLNEEKNVILRAAEFPSLSAHVGKRLIVTDGTTLLGADDKAGVAEILTAAEELLRSGAPHGRVRVAITPDEEVGRGTESFDIPYFGADYAYTVDGGTLGELEYENFNAAAATALIHGVSIHPGSAKDKMINACLVAMEFNALLPEAEIPARTEGYEGFFHLGGMQGGVEEAKLSYIIRDHDREKFERRKEQFAAAAAALNERYGAGTVEVRLRDSYYNMKEKILPHMYIIERAAAAMAENGVAPRTVPIRGGTDGAQLSWRGLPCPNLCTGGENFHGRFEYIPVEDMERMVAILKSLVTDLVD